MPSLDTPARKRKAHTKSRQGCGNCKLRRVKCDESRPECAKCTSFGVACDYQAKDSNLQFASVGAFRVEIPQIDIPNAIDKLIDGMMDAPLYLHTDDAAAQASAVCYIDRPHLDLLRKFQRRTVLTIGTRATSHVYRDELLKMASKHSFVLHNILRITLMHDRYLYDPLDTQPSAAEAFHSYHGVALFSKKLASPMREEEKDAMWGTAAMLGACAFANIDGSSYENAWPLRASQSDDLDWLKMSVGKKEVWRLADPLRDGSVWQNALNSEQTRKQSSETRQPSFPDLDVVFSHVKTAYNFDAEASDAAKGPYHTAVSIIERLVPMDCTWDTIMWFLSFLGHMQPDFQHLLELKDPSALVLLSWWYAKLIPYGIWWMSRRALFECQAICVHLDRTLPAEDGLRRLLEFPRSACGLQPSAALAQTSPSETFTPSPIQEQSWQWKQNF